MPFVQLLPGSFVYQQVKLLSVNGQFQILDLFDVFIKIK